MLSSTAFMEGEMIPEENACDGANISPDFAWTGGPPADSYAIVFTDLSNGLIHWILWDVSSDTMALAADIDMGFAPADVPGAKQSLNYANQRVYAGPCPPNTHTYEFKLHAVDEYPLSGVDMGSSTMQLRTAIEAHSLASATLTGMYTPP